MSNKSVAFIVLALGSILLLSVGWTLVFPVRTIEVTAVPSSVMMGEDAVIHVALRNSLGLRAPLARREVAFRIEKGSECGTLHPTEDPMTIRVQTLHPGEIEIQVIVEGSMLPYQIVLRVEHALAQSI